MKTNHFRQLFRDNKENTQNEEKNRKKAGRTQKFNIEFSEQDVKIDFQVIMLQYLLRFNTYQELGRALGGVDRSMACKIIKGSYILKKRDSIYRLADALGIKRTLLERFYENLQQEKTL